MVHASQFNRREILELALAAGVVGDWAAAQPQPARRDPREPASAWPRNVIFLVSDGMSLGVPGLAESFSHLARGGGTHWYRLLQDGSARLGFFETFALNSLVTDSAAASTAWASGSRVFNGALNMLPDGRNLTPIAHLVRDSGRRVGLVTTTTVTHATPAGFAAVQANRDDEDLIAAQYLERVDVLLGGGRDLFAAGTRADGRDLLAEFAGRGYVVWEDRAQLRSGGRPERVLGLFYPKHLPFTIDQRRQPELAERVPTLAELARTALEILSMGPAGFLLQIEGGRVDHAAHRNDAAALLWDQLAFDDALGVALDFARRRADTLVIATSDHGNANPGLNGMGDGYRRSVVCFERLLRATVSFEALAGALVPAAGVPLPEPGELTEIVRAATGIAIRSAEAEALRDALSDCPGGPEISGQQRAWVGVLGQILGNHNGIGWTGTSHTADLALLTAVGPGADRFAGLLKNTDAYHHLTALHGIEHENPHMSSEQARPYLAHAATGPRPHWA